MMRCNFIICIIVCFYSIEKAQQKVLRQFEGNVEHERMNTSLNQDDVKESLLGFGFIFQFFLEDFLQSKCVSRLVEMNISSKRSIQEEIFLLVVRNLQVQIVEFVVDNFEAFG